ncbi:MAG: type 1 glutamine amidotransferase [Planctomycetota bacterium]|nr:type 1 glutamine amidotransferase [Planctomycetota bacterium]
MNILVFQHSDLGHAGRLADTLGGRGIKLDVRRADLFGQDAARGVPASLDGIDGVIMMGGAGFVTDAPSTPWMQWQGGFIRLAHEAGLPVVGVCLGAQMIGQVLGGVVGFKETPAAGMHQASLTLAGQLDVAFSGIAWEHPQFFSCSQEVKQLPPGATLLASAPGTVNAAFRVGSSTYAFQSHPESHRPMLDSLVSESASAFSKAGISPETAAAQIARDYALYDRVGWRLMENLAAFIFRSAAARR